MENEEFEDYESEDTEEYDTSESDYLSEPEGTTVYGWDGETPPDQIDNWETPEDKAEALELWEVEHPTPWDGRSEPKEEMFDDYDSYQDAKIQYRVNQELSGRAGVVPQPPDHPADTDPYFPEKQEAFNQVQKYADDEVRALSKGDAEAAQHARQMKESFVKDLEKLESLKPTPAYAAAIEQVKGEYLADVENAVSRPAEFQAKKATVGEQKLYGDATQRLKLVNLDADDDTLYYLEGDTKERRHPDWGVAKIELPKGMKAQILRDAAMGERTAYSELLRYGYIEPLPPVEVDNDDLDSADPNDMTQAQYERWRASHGAKPKYISPIAGIARER